MVQAEKQRFIVELQEEGLVAVNLRAEQTEVVAKLNTDLEVWRSELKQQESEHQLWIATFEAEKERLGSDATQLRSEHSEAVAVTYAIDKELKQLDSEYEQSCAAALVEKERLLLELTVEKRESDKWRTEYEAL